MTNEDQQRMLKLATELEKRATSTLITAEDSLNETFLDRIKIDHALKDLERCSNLRGYVRMSRSDR